MDIYGCAHGALVLFLVAEGFVRLVPDGVVYLGCSMQRIRVCVGVWNQKERWIVGSGNKVALDAVKDDMGIVSLWCCIALIFLWIRSVSLCPFVKLVIMLQSCVGRRADLPLNFTYRSSPSSRNESQTLTLSATAQFPGGVPKSVYRTKRK
jgi:hypothetical protein